MTSIRKMTQKWDHSELLVVSLQWHLYDAFLLSYNTVLLLGEDRNQLKFGTAVAKVLSAGSCRILLRYLLLCVLQFFLLPLWHQVIQPAQFSFRKDEIQQLTDKHQGQDLI